jgi:hypothetical protein
MECKKFPEEKFNRNDPCSTTYLEHLKEGCSDIIKKWIDKNEKLLCRFKNGQIRAIILPCQKDQCVDFIQKRYKEVTGFEDEDFSGKSIFFYSLRDIKTRFDGNFSELKKKLDEEQVLESKIKFKADLPFEHELLSDEYSKQVEEFVSQIEDKIREIDFEFDPQREKLSEEMSDIINEDFKKFCEIKNKEDFGKNGQELKDKIAKIKGDLCGSFIAMLKPKVKNWGDLLEEFLKSAKEKEIKKQTQQLRNLERVSLDSIIKLIHDVNVANLVDEDLLDKILETLDFGIECVELGVNLKSKFETIPLSYEQCGIVSSEVKKFENLSLLPPATRNSVLKDLFKYIHAKKLVNETGELSLATGEFDDESSQEVNIAKFAGKRYKDSWEKKKRELEQKVVNQE